MIADAQADIRRAYVGGGPGAFVSGLVWLAAGLVERWHGTGPAFATLFFGGMLIFPLGALLVRLTFRPAPAMPDNPLGATALESTVAMIGGVAAAWLFLPTRPDLVLPLAAVAVGTHYAVFRTVYGDRTYWLFAALITAVGVYGVIAGRPPGGPALPVAAIEIIFAAILTRRAPRG